MTEGRIKAIEEVSRAGQRRAQTPHQRTGKLVGGQWYTLVHEEPTATTVPPKALLDRFASLGFPVHAELEKTTQFLEVEYRQVARQVQVWRIYVKIPAWELDRDWASVANEEWVRENSGD